MSIASFYDHRLIPNTHMYTSCYLLWLWLWWLVMLNMLAKRVHAHLLIVLTVLKWGNFNSADVWVCTGAEVYLRGGPDVHQRGPHKPLLQAWRARREQVVHLGDQVESHISNRRSSDYIVEVRKWSRQKALQNYRNVSIFWTSVKFICFSVSTTIIW